MTKDYIPNKDDDFDHWLAKFNTWVAAHGATHGLTAQQTGDLSTKVDAWSDRFSDFNNAKDAFHTATQGKDIAREEAEALARADAAIIQKNPNTTDADREAAGLTVPKSGHSPTPVPDSVPLMQRIDTSSRGILRLFYVDSATPDRKAKPPGVAYAEIREQIGGTMPTNPEAMQPLAMEGRAPYRADYEMEDIGKTVYFILRWVNVRGEAGPWSAISSAVVPS